MIPFFRRSKCLNSLTEVSSNPCTKDVTHEGAGEQVTVVTALMNLIESVDPSRRSGRLAALRGDPVILAFDEAHSLTRRGKIEIPNSLQQWSSLSEFFHVLRSLNGSQRERPMIPRAVFSWVRFCGLPHLPISVSINLPSGSRWMVRPI